MVLLWYYDGTMMVLLGYYHGTIRILLRYYPFYLVVIEHMEVVSGAGELR